MKLAINLLRRNWRSGELKLLGFSLMLAVAVLSGIAIFTVIAIRKRFALQRLAIAIRPDDQIH